MPSPIRRSGYDAISSIGISKLHASHRLLDGSAYGCGALVREESNLIPPYALRLLIVSASLA